MEHEEDVTRPGLSRRGMIKGAVGATAAVWAAPAITTLGARAFASHNPVCRGADWNCGDLIQECGASGPLGLCVCDADTEGNPLCWENFFCGSTAECASSKDCPAGYFCATTCCGQTCAPVCGTNHSTVQTSGATAAG